MPVLFQTSQVYGSASCSRFVYISQVNDPYVEHPALCIHVHRRSKVSRVGHNVMNVTSTPLLGDKIPEVYTFKS